MDEGFAWQVDESTGERPRRLRGVDLETDYTYDPLNDLVTVTKKGVSADAPRVRTFSYNGMSRLTYAWNPESIASGVCSASGPWSAIYSYDANGNVITRTDARGIITHYAYDGMNRLTAKSYSNDPANTPALSFGYDQEYPGSCKKTKTTRSAI